MRLNVLIERAMDDIFHVLLTKPNFTEATKIADSFVEFSQDASKQKVLKKLGIPHGFAKMEQEKTEFMIDIIDTLLD